MSEILGRVIGLSDNAYRARGGLSSTTLRQFLTAPAKAHYRQQNPDHSPPSDVFVTGILCHAMVLEPETVAERFLVLPEDLDRRTKAGKAQYRELQEQVGEGHLVKPEQMQVAIGVRDSVMGHEWAGKVFAAGEPEVSVFARDPVTDLLLQCRCDWLPRYLPMIVDLKTCQSASAGDFARHAVQYGYHLQAVHYLETCRMAGLDVQQFLFVAVEKEPPYLCQVFALSDVLKSTALNVWRQGVDQYAQCQALDVWPGYGSQIVTIDQPRWMSV